MTRTHVANTFQPGQKVHKFEVAGLGDAPYTYLGCSRKVFQACQGAPEQAGGSCDYCGTGIMFQFHLRSADGREFKVGSDCILKTDSTRALIVPVKTEVQKHQKALRDARAQKKCAKDVARIAAAVAQLPLVADAFAAEPHPMAASGPFFATKTRLDWANWMLANAGLSGRLTVAKAIETSLVSSKGTV